MGGMLVREPRWVSSQRLTLGYLPPSFHLQKDEALKRHISTFVEDTRKFRLLETNKEPPYSRTSIGYRDRAIEAVEEHLSRLQELEVRAACHN